MNKLAIISAVFLISCSQRAYSPALEKCINVETNEVIIFDSKKSVTNGILNPVLIFKDQDGFERAVTLETISNWKCKRLIRE